MKFLLANKSILIGGAILAAVLFAYFNFFSGSTAELLTSTGDATESPISQELLVSLTNVYTIKLDSSIFTHPVFVSLTSFGVEIAPENIGRRNPFAPLSN